MREIVYVVRSGEKIQAVTKSLAGAKKQAERVWSKDDGEWLEVQTPGRAWVSWPWVIEEHEVGS